MSQVSEFAVPPGEPLPLSWTTLIFGATSFGMLGIANAAMFALLPDLKHAIHLTDDLVGSAIAIGLVTAFPFLVSSGWFINRLGANRVVAAALCCLGIGFGGMVLTGNFVQMACALSAFWIGFQLLNVAANAAAISMESIGRKPFMPLMHGSYSGFLAAGAIGCGMYLTSGFPFRRAYALVTGLFMTFGLVVLLVRPLPDSRAQKMATGRPLHERSLYFDLGMWAIVVVLFLGMVGDQGLLNWSTIYLRDSVGSTALMGSMGLAVLQIAMMTGRFSLLALLRKIPRRTILTGSGLLTATATAASLSAHKDVLAIGGFFVVGLSLSVVQPLLMSIAGDRRPGRAGEVSSLINVASFAAATAIPLIIGWSAKFFGLRAALSIIIPAALLVALLGPRIDQRAGIGPRSPGAP
jgi:fucose permease